jgi:phage tail-like protein
MRLEAVTIRALLPEVFRARADVQGGVMEDLLEAMVDLHAPVHGALEELERYFDCYRCPDRFVPFLTHWVGFDYLASNVPTADHKAAHDVDLVDARNLVRSAMNLTRRRGTRSGMTSLLETATGCEGFVIDDGGGRPFHMYVTAPPGALNKKALVRRIVEQEKPAYMTVEIVWSEEP